MMNIDDVRDFDAMLKRRIHSYRQNLRDWLAPHRLTLRDARMYRVLVPMRGVYTPGFQALPAVSWAFIELVTNEGPTGTGEWSVQLDSRSRACVERLRAEPGRNLLDAEFEAFRGAELRARHLGEGDGGERLADRQVYALPMRSRRAEIMALAVGLVDRALGHADGPADRCDDLGDRNFGGVAGEPIAPGGAAQGRHDSRPRQAFQHLGDSCLRQTRLGGDRRRVDLPIRMSCQVGGNDDAIIGELAQDDHVTMSRGQR